MSRSIDLEIDFEIAFKRQRLCQVKERGRATSRSLETIFNFCFQLSLSLSLSLSQSVHVHLLACLRARAKSEKREKQTKVFLGL